MRIGGKKSPPLPYVCTHVRGREESATLSRDRNFHRERERKGGERVLLTTEAISVVRRREERKKDSREERERSARARDGERKAEGEIIGRALEKDGERSARVREREGREKLWREREEFVREKSSGEREKWGGRDSLSSIPLFSIFINSFLKDFNLKKFSKNY